MSHLPVGVAVLLALGIFSPSVSITWPWDTVALAAFKSAVDPSSIPSFSCLFSWNFTPPCDPCRTFPCGLSCSSDGRVTAITLDPAGYSGHLSASISNLSSLQSLDLSGNLFRSPFPSSLPDLRSLLLSSNAFSGPIPSILLSNLSSLQTLDLSMNSFDGPIPASLSALIALSTLDLSHNRLNGPIPSSLPPNLVTLALRSNALSGPLLRSPFVPLQSLAVLNLAGNRLNGTLNPWLLKLPKIQQLNAANNSFQAWEVLPANSGEGEDLVAIDVGFNRIAGYLPPELAGYPSLVAVTVSYNQLRGEIPRQYHEMKRGAAFARLFLAGNFFRGSVPAAFFDGEMKGSFRDNCFDGCPLASEMCFPGQKPASVCRAFYYSAAGSRRRLGFRETR